MYLYQYNNLLQVKHCSEKYWGILNSKDLKIKINMYLCDEYGNVTIINGTLRVIKANIKTCM